VASFDRQSRSLFGLESHEMSQNATPSGATPNPNELTAKHLAAIERLVAGATVEEAATAAGVARETVHRWLTRHWAFQAQLNSARADLRDATERRLLQIAHAAANTIDEAVRRGNVAAAVAVLKGVGFLDGSRPQLGPVAAKDVEADAALRRQEDEMLRMLRSRVG
jgi:hypothetical protein